MKRKRTRPSFDIGQLSFDLDDLSDLHDILKFLRNEPRQSIIRYLHEKKRATVSEIFEGLGIEQSYCSQLLSSLRNVGLITSNREGHYVYYQNNYDLLSKLNRFMEGEFIE